MRQAMALLALALLPAIVSGALQLRWNDAEPGKGYDTKSAEWSAKLPSTNPTTKP